MKRKTIPLPNFDCSAHPQVSVNGQSRHATATACGWLSDRLLVVGHFLAARLWVIDVDTEDVIDECVVPGHVDLLDTDPETGLVVTANFPYGEHGAGVSLLHFGSASRALSHIRTVHTPTIKPHGIRFVPGSMSHVVICSTNDRSGIYELDMDAGGPVLKHEMKMACKDILLTEDPHQWYTAKAIALAHGVPGTDVDNDEARLLVFDTGEETGRVLPFHGLPDCIAHDGRRTFYVTVQDRHQVLVFRRSVEGLYEEPTAIDGFAFPHGCAFRHGRLAVTNYGTNTVDILSELE